MVRCVVAVVLALRVAHADPAPAAPIAEVRCDIGPYLSPSLMVAVGSTTPAPRYVEANHNAGAVHSELAAGAVFRLCDADRRAATHVRVGAYFYITNVSAPGDSRPTGGIGLESEVDRPISDRHRLGGQLQLASAEAGAKLFTAGARLHYRDLLWAGVDAFRVTNPSEPRSRCTEYAVPGCKAPMTGLRVGFGVEGRFGTLVGAAGLVAVVVGAIVIAASLGGVH